MNSVVLFFNNMSGIFTSMMDLGNGIKNHKQSEFIIVYDKFSDIMKFKKYFVDFEQLKLIPTKAFRNYKYDTLILSANTFNRLRHIPGSYNNLIILDSSTLYFNTELGGDLVRKIKQLRNKVILGNPFNNQYFEKDYVQYFHKLDPKRLTQLKSIKEENDVLTGNRYQFKETKDINPFSYREYQYTRGLRHKKFYYENIGKLIFEFSWLRKKVFYSNKNKYFDDGLTQYLKLFNIDDGISQQISISKNEMEDKLFMNENDKIFEFLS